MKDAINFSWLQSGELFRQFALKVLYSQCFNTRLSSDDYVANREEFNKCQLYFRRIITRVATNNISLAQFEKEVLGETEGIESTDLSFVFTETQRRKRDIKGGMVNVTMASMPSAVNQFDWSVKYAVSSSKVMQLNQPLLKISLMHSNNNDKLDNVNLLTTELTELQLDDFIHKLRSAQTKISKLK